MASSGSSTHGLSNNEIGRYSRQLILPEWGVKGIFIIVIIAIWCSLLFTAQDNIKTSSVLIVGAGGLGCPAAQYLAAAGIGQSVSQSVIIILVIIWCIACRPYRNC